MTHEMLVMCRYIIILYVTSWGNRPGTILLIGNRSTSHPSVTVLISTKLEPFPGISSSQNIVVVDRREYFQPRDWPVETQLLQLDQSLRDKQGGNWYIYRRVIQLGNQQAKQQTSENKQETLRTLRRRWQAHYL